VETLALDGLNVLPRGQVTVFGVAGNPSADGDAGQVPLAAQALSCVIQPARQLVATPVGVHLHLDAVQRVAVFIVVANEAIVRHRLPVVQIGVVPFVDDQARRTGDEVAVHPQRELPLREARHQRAKLGRRGRFHVGEAGALEGGKGLVVVDDEALELEAGLEIGQVDGHGSGVYTVPLSGPHE